MVPAVALTRFLGRPGGVVRLVPARVRGTLLRTAIGRLLQARRLDEVLELLAAPARATPPRSRSTSAAGVVTDLRRLPATCLHRALAAYAVLRGAGGEARFVIGVRRDEGEVLAHAWIEEDGAPAGEPEDPGARFTVAYVHPAPAAGEGEREPMPTPRPNPDVLLTRLADGSGVLLHLGTKFYFALNRSGVTVWEALAGGQAADPDGLADLLVARFSGAERARARADVETLLRELAAEGLLTEEP